MDRGQAKNDAEALRYRLIVRLALIRREAVTVGRSDAVTFAAMLRTEVEAVNVADDPSAAQKKLLTYVPKVDKLQRDLGLPEHGVAVFPKWMRFSAWVVPILAMLGVLAIIIERRRGKKKTVDEADVRALEESDEAIPRPSGPSPRQP